ncbi:MAG: hypothetical protein VYA84_01185 [Planctomycetota bacterium]|nr:hypothetical protein [Planctomycetota bacterium]
MNRTVVSGIAAFALVIGASLAMNETKVEAGNCGGGLFSGLQARSCEGGLFSGLPARSCEGGLFSGLPARSCGGGLFSGLKSQLSGLKSELGGLKSEHCGGGLLARLKALHACDCCAPEPACEGAPCDGCDTEEASEMPAPESASDDVPPAPEADAETDA